MAYCFMVVILNIVHLLDMCGKRRIGEMFFLRYVAKIYRIVWAARIKELYSQT